ncbi:hypothetical protein GCM10027037_02830 [Mucilaginibacter koreensis]
MFYKTKFHFYTVLLLLSVASLISSTGAMAQQYNTAANTVQRQANKAYGNKDLKRAAQLFMAEYRLRDMVAYQRNAIGNAGYCYAQSQMPDSALACFTASAQQYGFRNLRWLETATELVDMRKLAGYGLLKQYLQKQEFISQNPNQAQIITSDIDLFWKVYDRYQKDTTNGGPLFETEYFAKGTPALQEYYRIKTPNIGGLKAFMHNMATMPAYYRSIRQNSLKVKAMKDTFRHIFTNLKAWYPGSTFPNTTFVMGGWSSGGTSTDDGAIVGADMQSADAHTVTTELNTWQQHNLIPLNGMKYVVAHELIHVQQGQMTSDTTLLSSAIKEGMADFIGQLISGRTANERLHTFAKGREAKIWADFKKEMYLNRYSNWIANSNQETPEHPADLGYWVGYQICKAYFNQAPNKKQAIYDMLHIQDYKAFLATSQLDAKLSLH